MSDMDAFKKAREAQKRAEEERIKAERELRQHATQKFMTAKAREKEAFALLLARLGALKLRILPDKQLTVLRALIAPSARVRATKRQARSRLETPSSQARTFCSISKRKCALTPPWASCASGWVRESAVGGKQSRAQGLIQEWNDVESFMQQVIQWALSVPNLEAL